MCIFLYRIYAEAATIRDDLKSAAIDVVADIKTERVPHCTLITKILNNNSYFS